MKVSVGEPVRENLWGKIFAEVANPQLGTVIGLPVSSIAAIIPAGGHREEDFYEDFSEISR